MSDIQELLPCPFCGGKAVFRDFHDGECAIEIDHKDGCWIFEDWDLVTDIQISRKDEAISAWNQRYQPTCQWKYDQYNKHVGFYKTSCGHFFECKSHGLTDCCPRCGGHVEVVD